MKLKHWLVACSLFSFTLLAHSQQSSITDQINAVNQAEQQIRAQQQMQQAQQAQQQYEAQQNALKQQNAERARQQKIQADQRAQQQEEKARTQAEQQEEKARNQAYQDKLRQIEIDSLQADLEMKKARAKRADDFVEKELNPNRSKSSTPQSVLGVDKPTVTVNNTAPSSISVSEWISADGAAPPIQPPNAEKASGSFILNSSK